MYLFTCTIGSVNKRSEICVGDEDAANIKFTGPCCTKDGSYKVLAI